MTIFWDTCIDPINAPLLADYFQRLGLDMSAPITLVFPEAGGGCTELALTKELLARGHISCERILFMDRDYADPLRGKPVTGDDNVSTYNSYGELTDVLAKTRGAVAVVGLHQQHSFHSDIDVAEYEAFMQWCIGAEKGGQLVTPYINIVDCTTICQLLAASRGGLFEPLVEGSHLRVNCRTWDQLHAYMHLHGMRSNLPFGSGLDLTTNDLKVPQPVPFPETIREIRRCDAHDDDVDDCQQRPGKRLKC